MGEPAPVPARPTADLAGSAGSPSPPEVAAGRRRAGSCGAPHLPGCRRRILARSQHGAVLRDRGRTEAADRDVVVAELAGYLVAGAQLLSEMLVAEQAARAETATRLREVDHAAEAAAHAVLRELSASFVTPFDRADIYQLSWAMRSCIGHDSW